MKLLSLQRPPDPAEREAIARLFDELRRAANSDLPTAAAWRLLGIIAAIAGMGASDVRAGVGAELLHRHADSLAEAVAALERGGR
jgi:hypothetical protein